MYFLAPIIIAAAVLIFDHVGAAAAALANHAVFMMCAAYLVGAPPLKSHNWFRKLGCLWVWQLIVGALAGLLVMAPWYWASQGWQWGSIMLASLSTAIYFAVCLPYWPGYALSVFPAGRADEEAPAGLNFSESSQLAKISSWKQGVAAVATLLAITVAPLALWYFRDTMASWYYARVALYAVVLAPAAHIFLALGVERTTRHLGSLATAPTMDPVPPPSPSAEITQESSPEEEPTDDYAAETLLLDSIRTNDLTRIHELLNRGTNPNAEVHTASSVTTPLLAAISDGRTDAVRLLLQAGASATLSRDGLTPVICAVQSGLGSGVVQELIDAGADVNEPDLKPSYALHYAAFEGDLATIGVLLKAGAALEAVNNQGHTALLTACASGHWDAASALIDAGAAILPESGQSPLYAASCISSDDPKGVQLLLDKGADVNHAAKLGRTCLMGASLHGNAEIAETLLEAGADINARDDFGISALMEASRSGANRVLERFLFWNPETEHRDKPGRTALLVAASSRRADEETVRLLLAMGADPAVRNREKRLVADLAAGNGRWRIAQMLRDKIEPASQFPPDAEIAQRILEEEVEPPELLSSIDALQEPTDFPDNISDAVAEAPSAADLAELEAEIMQARVPSVSELEAMVYSAKILDRESIEAEGDDEAETDSAVPEDIDAFAEEFMNLARTGDEAELHAFLLQHTGIPEWILSHAFFAAAEAGHQQCASRLLEAGVPANARSETDEPLLTHFCRRVPPALQLIATLIERGADTSADGENAELLIWLCGKGELESYTATGRRTLLAEPEEEGLARVIELAARRGADVNQGDAEGRTPLSWALEYRSPRVVESLLRYGADPDAQMPDNRSALMQACQSKRDVATSLVRLLVKYGGDPHLKTADGESAFSLAMNDNRETILKFLMMGAGASQPSEVENLVVAAANGTLSTVRRALDAGADPNETDDQGCCALLRAAGSGHYHIVDHLLRHEVELDLPAANGMTALGAAVSAGHLEIVRRLKLAGANIDHQQQQGITPLILAAARGNADMVTLLLDQNAQVDLADDTESTALMAATQNALFSARSEDALETIKRLIKAGANVDTVNNDGQTALMLLLGVRAQQVQGANEPLLCEVADLLLTAGADPDQRDLTGWSSMHAAASHGLVSPVRLLMDAGANRRQRDINGHSACDLAMEKGHHEVVELFVASDS